MKILPTTLITTYPKDISYSVIPGSIYDFWLGLVYLSGIQSIERVIGNKTHGICKKGDVALTDNADPRKRTKLIFPGGEINYAELKTNSIKGVALEESTSYLCFHQSTSFGPKTAELIEKNGEWPWPLLYKSKIITNINPSTVELIENEYLYVAAGTIKINGIEKKQNSWISTTQTKIVSIESVTEESILAFLK